MNVVALSSSRVDHSAYLEPAIPYLNELFGTKPVDIAFIPFASVGSYQEYYRKVSEAFSGFPYNIKMASLQNAKQLIGDCEGVMVGGGNTFKLLHDLYEADVIGLIRHRVKSGLPYLGWSAGSNVLGATIGTTNDMPIIYPESFKALGIFPFQINPHYHNHSIHGFNGETRDQRIEEFLTLNKDATVVAIPEGSALVMNRGLITYKGIGGARFFVEDGSVDSIVMHNGFHIELRQSAKGSETSILP